MNQTFNLSIDTMLEKMQASDRDFRYMALSDLLQEFGKPGFRLENNIENRLSTQLMKMLEDKSVDVQGLAVQCLANMLSMCSDTTTNKICADLMTNITDPSSKSEVKRDISVTTLKKAVPSLPCTDVGGATVRKLFPQLLNAVSSTKAVEFQLECVEVVQALASRFGTYLVHDFSLLVDTLLPLLSAERSVLRKRSISCIGAVSSSLSDALFSRLVNFASDKLKSGKCLDVRTSSQLLVALSVSSGHRFLPFLANIVGLVLNHINADVPEPDDDICEMLESSLLALQTFVQRCPKEMSPHIADVVSVALRFLKFDPNYAADSDEDNDNAADSSSDIMAVDNDDDDDDDYDDASDEYEDASWKARRASCKLLTAVIYARPDMLNDVSTQITLPLVKRFTEREENVKLDVFQTFIDLLRQTNSLLQLSAEPEPTRQLISNLAARIVQSLVKQSKHKSAKVRSGVLQVCTELAGAVEPSATWHLHLMVQQVGRIWTDRSVSNTLKIDVLVFLKSFLSHIKIEETQKAELQKELSKCSDVMVKGVGERYFKTTIAALEVCTEFIRVLSHFSLETSSFLDIVFKLALAKFATQEQDSEIKERAMTCIGTLIALFGDKLEQSQTDTALSVLLERLDNDIIRLSAVKAFLDILSSPLALDLGKILEPLTMQLSSFLRQSSRLVKHTSIVALTQLVIHHGSRTGDAQLEVAIKESSSLVAETDVHMAGLALKLVVCVLNVQQGKCVPSISELVIPKTVSLAKSPLLQGGALHSLLDLLGGLAHVNHDSLPVDKLLVTFTTISDDQEVPRASLHNVSRCISKLALSTTPNKCDAIVAQLIEASSSTVIPKAVCSLLSLGRIGRERDLTHIPNLIESILGLFESQNEEVKTAASFSLGSIAAGNMPKLVPVLLDLINTRQAIQYLLLHSLKEVISRQVESNDTQTASSLTSVLPLLFEHANHQEEGVRNVVAECLGKMALLSPGQVVPQMTIGISSESEFVRSTMVTALKFSLTSSHSAALDPTILEVVSKFLALIDDKDLLVRRVALVSLNTIVHHRSETVRPVLPLVPHILSATIIRPELVRQVQLGPFKHTIDDGLPIRKAAFECLNTLFDKTWHVVDVGAIVHHVLGGLDDEYDIKMLCHHILGKVATAQSTSQALVAVLEQLAPPLTKTLTTKTKENAVQQEVERNQDMIRSTMRLVFAMSKVVGMDSHPRFITLLDTASKTPTLQTMWQEVSQETVHHLGRRASSSLLAVDGV